MADLPDRRRLRQIQQQDLTESRLNDDFVYWLKTKGINYALIVAVAACVYMGYHLWQQKRTEARDLAWAELREATLPQSFDELAKVHGNVDSVALVAWLSAGDAHLRDVQTGMLGGIPIAGPDGSVALPIPLDAEARKIAQNSADEYYTKVIDATAKDEGTLPLRLSALFGRAAVAESREDLPAAKSALQEIVELAQEPYPRYAEHASSRLASLGKLETPITIPARADLPARPDAGPAPENVAESLLKSLQEPATVPAPTPAPTPPAPTPPAPTPAPTQAPGTQEPAAPQPSEPKPEDPTSPG